LLLEEQQRIPRLTPRERQILELVSKGKTNAEVAEALWLSPGTVRRHLENVFAKLGVHTRTAAAALLRDGNCLGETAAPSRGTNARERSPGLRRPGAGTWALVLRRSEGSQGAGDSRVVVRRPRARAQLVSGPACNFPHLLSGGCTINARSYIREGIWFNGFFTWSVRGLPLSFS